MLLSKLSYFDNVNAIMSPALLAAIHETIHENERYAAVIWRSRKDDALDATLHQAIKHYSREKGELRHYIISTMKSILKNVLRNESSMEDETLHYHVDTQNEKEEELSDVEILINADSDDLETCVKDFLPYLVEDFEFFSTQKATKRKGNYYNILSSYSSKTVVGALKYIQEYYLPKLEPFMTSSCIWNKYTSEKTLQHLKEEYASKDVEFLSMQDGVVLLQGTNPRRLVKTNIGLITDILVRELYGNGSNLKKSFLGKTYYKTPSDGLVQSESELKESIQKALFYFICKKCKADYVFDKDGYYYFLVSSIDFSYPVFSKTYTFPMEIVGRKEL